MATGSNASGRAKPTKVHSKQGSGGFNKVVRKGNVSNSENTHTINSDKAEMCYLEIPSSETRSADICFDSDVIANDFFTLAPGERTPPFGVNKGTEINYIKSAGPGGTGTLIIVLWG